MKIPWVCAVLLPVGAYGISSKEAHTSGGTLEVDSDDLALTPQNNYNGWVNPEDLPSMPQCIAQQDQTAWLNTMTQCTGKRCTKKFGFICTHHQWVTELSCLNTGFSSDVIREYLPYCGRSILAKAQLYNWIRNTTSRTWLVDVGDANGLENLSPTSLVRGYAGFEVVYRAPTCLTDSASALTKEPFGHIVASCSFTATTQHTGNAGRPWEYRESLQSMVSLDSETLGYDLVGRIRAGDYFDKECLCSSFTINPQQEPCPGAEQLDRTKQWLWIRATCGPDSLPSNWTDGLKTTGFAYVPLTDWHWPKCVAEDRVPERVNELVDQCSTEACGLDSGGYCQVKRAVDRACFCGGISYTSFTGSCQVFEKRFDYVKWLHELCGNVPDWHGLPKDWRPLALPTILELLPWWWTVKPTFYSSVHLQSLRSSGRQRSSDWTLASLALVNIATFLALALSSKKTGNRIARILPWNTQPWSWLLTGVSIAGLQVLANLINAVLVQTTTGYEAVPIIQLTLLWCSIPRLTWLPVLRIAVQPFDTINIRAAAASLSGEMILQLLSLYYMLRTFTYGWEHHFYSGALNGVQREGSAKLMYAGAFLYFGVIVLGFTLSVQPFRMMRCPSGSGVSSLRECRRSARTTSKMNIAEELMAQMHDHWQRLEKKLCPVSDIGIGETSSLLEEGDHPGYGTMSSPAQDGSHEATQVAAACSQLYAVIVVALVLFWVAQLLFWAGFIGLAGEEFCLPKLGILTAVWMVSAVTSAAFGLAAYA